MVLCLEIYVSMDLNESKLFRDIFFLIWQNDKLYLKGRYNIDFYPTTK